MGVQTMKHAAPLQECSARIAECRSSKMSVKAWCKEQEIPIKTYYYWEKKFVTEATQQFSLPAATQTGILIASFGKPLRSVMARGKVKSNCKKSSL